jgi:hypothetical protein
MKIFINKPAYKTLVCDFCVDHSRKVNWWYAAKDDIMETNEPPPKGQTNIVLQSHPDGKSTILAETKVRLILESIGGRWAACDRCRELIDDRFISILAIIASEQFVKNHQLTLSSDQAAILIDRIFNVQQAFWRNYKGDGAYPMESNN